jgi:5-methylcytosine-specific restriction endonuclease McrA
MLKSVSVILSVVALLGGCGHSPPEPANKSLDPLVDYRQTGQVPRTEAGKTERSAAVLAAFREKYPCPATGKSSGSCPGWAIDHVIPLACGGVDAVYNLQWLPNTIKSAKGSDSKDHFERKIYGGQGASKGCP